MVQKEANEDRGWDKVYAERFMTNWYPNEDVVRFCARLIRKRLTHDQFEVKRPIENVLDLGCGNGRHAIYFAQEGMKASGIDVSPQAIAWAQDWARRENLAVDFRLGKIEQLPYPDHAFDAAVSHGVLDHVRMETARRAAEEVHRVLKPGGLFYCDLRCADDFEFGTGEEVAPNTFVVSDGFERGLVQHFFSAPETAALFDGLFRILYSEITERRLAPDFQRRYSRWIFAAESI